MAGAEKQIIQKNAHGDSVLTPYGEFLSYFHAHIKLFNALVAQLAIPSSQKDQLKNQIRSFIVSHVKKTDHFFDEMPKFAAFLQTDVQTLSAYMTNNFLPTLKTVQEKLITQEEEKQAQGPKAKVYNQITEELAEMYGPLLSKDQRFEFEGNLPVIRDESSGEEIYPTGNAIFIVSFSSEESHQSTEGQAVKTVVKSKPPEEKILKELNDLYGDEFTGVKLEPGTGQLDESDLDAVLAAQTENSGNSSEPVDLSDVEELEFEDGELSFEDPGLDPEPDPDPEPIYLEFKFSEYMNLIQNLRKTQKQKDAQLYRQWVGSQTDENKCVLSIQNALVRETKEGNLDWNVLLGDLEQKSDLSHAYLKALKDRVDAFNTIRFRLETGLNEAKSLPPEVLDMARKAWPHVIRALDLFPNWEEVEGKIQNLLSKVPKQNVRDSLKEIFLGALGKARSVIEIPSF